MRMNDDYLLRINILKVKKSQPEKIYGICVKVPNEVSSYKISIANINLQ